MKSVCGCASSDGSLFVQCNKVIAFFLWSQVYDVTKFLEEHPGGDEVLLSATGMFSDSELGLISTLLISPLQYLL